MAILYKICQSGERNAWGFQKVSEQSQIQHNVMLDNKIQKSVTHPNLSGWVYMIFCCHTLPIAIYSSNLTVKTLG